MIHLFRAVTRIAQGPSEAESTPELSNQGFSKGWMTKCGQGSGNQWGTMQYQGADNTPDLQG